MAKRLHPHVHPHTGLWPARSLLSSLRVAALRSLLCRAALSRLARVLLRVPTVPHGAFPLSASAAPCAHCAARRFPA